MGGDQEKRRKKQKEIGPRVYKVKWFSTLNTSPNERSEFGITLHHQWFWTKIDVRNLLLHAN